jgi:GNAT superfamily N-acetyltransferase
MSVLLRPACAADDDFLYTLYCSTRQREMAAWGLDAGQSQMLLKMQFTSQQAQYRSQFPAADHDIILLDGQPIGRVMVNRSPEQNTGVDIALLPERRSKGIGGELIQALLDEAARDGKPFHIHVEKTNPAVHLYNRLGFATIADTGAHLVMEWNSKT